MSAIDFDLYSVLYKSLNGFRPRAVPSQEQYDSFMASYDANIQEEIGRCDTAEQRAVASCNEELGTDYKSVSDMDIALSSERDPHRYNVLLKWLTSY